MQPGADGPGKGAPAAAPSPFDRNSDTPDRFVCEALLDKRGGFFHRQRANVLDWFMEPRRPGEGLGQSVTTQEPIAQLRIKAQRSRLTRSAFPSEKELPAKQSGIGAPYAAPTASVESGDQLLGYVAAAQIILQIRTQPAEGWVERNGRASLEQVRLFGVQTEDRSNS